MTDLFAGTAGYYARYRPGYPAAVLDRLRAVFGLDGTGRLLDLGCGTGELARPLHADFEQAVGIDISPEMVAEARRQSARAGIANVRWLCLPAEEISVGDFVLAGGESAALVVLEAVIRLVPGVVGNEESLSEESFERGLLDHPHYTRPREFRGMQVPEPLLSGDHGRIEEWRRNAAREKTRRNRPDLLPRDEEGPR